MVFFSNETSGIRSTLRFGPLALPPELISHNKLKCPVPESNQRHTDFQSVALPTELTGHNAYASSCGNRI